MKRFIILSALVGVLSITVATVEALQPSEISVILNEVAERSVYGGEPEVLALDFTVAAPRGDVLDALFVRQEGTAQWQTDITGAALWVDDGPMGFQGISIDRLLVRGAWVASENGWVFDRPLEPVAAAGTRFFVTISTVTQPMSQTTVRLAIPVYRDAFRSMQYDTGDRGVFLRTARPAPLIAKTNTAVLRVFAKSVDDLPPVVRITEPKDGASFERNWLMVRGVAQDVGGSATAKVLVGINRSGRAITWVPAVPEVAAFGTWEARIFELAAPETYEIRVRGEDWVGNRSADSAPMTVTLTAPNVP